MKKIILISGKARHGKDTFAKFLKEGLENKGQKVLICHYGDLLKFIASGYLGWNREKDEEGRKLLQQVGTGLIREKEPDFWVDFIIKMLGYFGNIYDYVLIPDVRFPNEVDKVKEAFGDKVFHFRVVRPDFISDLTPEQLEHPSETALDNYPFDCEVLNDGTLKEFEEGVKYDTFLEKILKRNSLKLWKIPVYWQEAGIVTIKAKTLEEALKIAKDTDNNLPLPTGDYLEDSWEVSDLPSEEIRELYNNGQCDVR